MFALLSRAGFLAAFLTVFVTPSAFALFDHENVRLHLVENPLDPHSPPSLKAKKFNIDSSRGRREFREEIKKLLQLSERQKAVKKASGVLRFAYEIKSGGRKVLEQTLELLDVIERRDHGAYEATKKIQLMMASFQHNLAYPIKKQYHLVEAPYYLLKGIKHDTVKNGEPVESLVAVPGTNDSSRWDPRPSSFWRAKKNDGNVELRAGFGRASSPDFETPVCRYLEPKTGWGAHPGFTVNCGGDQDYKFKLGDEIYSGSFNTRMFWLLGYNVSSIDHVEQLKVAYDRRILSEFHSRRHLKFDIKFLFWKLKEKVITNYEDPFELIKFAKLKDGRKIPGMELKRLLMKVIPPGDPRTPEYKRPEMMPENFREELERQIDFLAFVPGAMALDSSDVKSIGPWKYDEFGADDLREVRAVQLLSAWVGNYNMRWENTRLNFVKQGKEWSLRHYFSDVGSGLGASKDLLKMTNSDVDNMLWRVTKPNSRGVELKGFLQNMPNPSFDKMTLEDARWILRKIAGISEKQIWDALLATGMSAAEQRLAFEKLLSRRAHMVRDFGLSSEFPQIVSRTFNEQFNFTPTPADGPHWSRKKIVRGKIVELRN